MSPSAPALAATPNTELDALVQKVKGSARAFARLGIPERLELLGAIKRGFYQTAEAQVRAACEAKGIPAGDPLAGEEWICGPMFDIRNVRLLEEALREVAQYGAPRIDPSWIRTLPDGRLAVRVFPTNAMESLLIAKTTAEVHLEPGITRENLSQHQATFYRQPHEGKLCVVLGAGNVNAIPPTDTLYKMFVEGMVVILKMNPVNAYVGPFVERAFQPLIERGFFAVVYGGPEVGKALVNHPLVDSLHMTGSDKTHDAIVWGEGPQAEENRRRNTPRLSCEVTSELGNVSPFVIVPGEYSEAELRYQAQNVAGASTHNASFDCTSAKLLVTAPDWPQRERFLAMVQEEWARVGNRKPYYPGAEDRFARYTADRKVKAVGSAGPGELPWTLIEGVRADDPDEELFRTESWCPILSDVSLGSAQDPKAFFEEAVRFLNDRVWGTLGANLVVHPKTEQDPAFAAAFEQGLRALRYGSVSVNWWAGGMFGLMTTPWGGHPSATLQDIQSGRGWVHNTFMIDGIEKCVLRAPVRASPIQLWFPAHRTLETVGRRLVDFEMGPSFMKLPGLALAALKG